MMTSSALKNFIAEVHRSIDREIEVASNKFKQTLFKKANKHKTLVNAATGENIIKACDQLKEKILENFKANLVIFSMYFSRNLSPHPQPLLLKSIPVHQDISNQIAIKQNKVNQLRERLNALHEASIAISQQLARTEALHTHLTKVLYTLRVGAQAFEEFDVHPINQTIAELLDKKNSLTKLIQRSEVALSKVPAHSAGEPIEDKYDSLDAFIDMDDEEATKAINKSLYSS